MGAEKLERRGQPEITGEEERGRARGRAAYDAPERVNAEPARPKTIKSSSPGAPGPASRPGDERPDAPERADSQSEAYDASFRLGDLFKDREPDIFSRWEQEEEEERRIRERRERRRAEAAKRVRGEDDASKMKTAAALFIAREGMRNFFGKFSGSSASGVERDAEEREAEKALREIADERDASAASARPERASEAAAREEVKDARKARKDRSVSERASARVERSASVDLADASAVSEGAEDASGYEEEGLFSDFFRRPGRPDRTAVAWIAGWAAGAAAIVIIALMIVNNHASLSYI
jgi:hypothetical protein